MMTLKASFDSPADAVEASFERWWDVAVHLYALASGEDLRGPRRFLGDDVVDLGQRGKDSLRVPESP